MPHPYPVVVFTMNFPEESSKMSTATNLIKGLEQVDEELIPVAA